MHWNTRAFSFAALAFLAVSLSVKVGEAQSIRYTKPLPPQPGSKTPAKPQPTVTVSSRFAREYGYCTVQVEYRTPTPVAAEQEVTVQVSFRGRRGRTVVQSEQTFLMPRGATRATTELLVPKYTAWHFVNWEVWVDGRREEALSATEDLFSVNAGRGGGGPVIVLVSNSPRSREMRRQNSALAHNGSTVAVLSFQELPQRWLGFTGYGAVTLSSSDFETLRSRHPQRYAALMRWVRAGGNLWIFDCEERWRGWRDKHFADGLSDDGIERTDSFDPQKSGWRTIKLNPQQEVELHGLIELSEADRRFAEPTVQGVKRAIRNFNARTSERIFHVRSHGMGTVTAFLPTNRLQDAVQAAWGSFLSGRTLWQYRHGNAPGGPNYEFNNLLIPGVGLAPVTEFQLLITLFVLAIGPLNYWLLRRAKKLPWLLVTTPVSAGLLTLFLFGYGLLADGTGVRVCARSVTFLDQTAGEAASWARLSYYAGIAPRDGLTLPDDTALYPIDAMMTSASNRYWRRPVINREMRWGSEHQELNEGWLASRSPTQYLSLTARPTGHRLDFTANADGLTVTNNLAVDVLSLAVEDIQGVSYWCEQLPAGETAKLTKIDRREQATNLRKIFLESEPSFPPGGEITQRYRNDRIMRISEGLLEAEIGAVISPLLDGLGRGRYVAITAKGVEVELGVETAEEEASFHVIKGRYARDSMAEEEQP